MTEQPVDPQPVQAVLDSLQTLDDTPVSEHVEVFERAHEQLRAAMEVRPEPAPDA